MKLIAGIFFVRCIFPSFFTKGGEFFNFMLLMVTFFLQKKKQCNDNELEPILCVKENCFYDTFKLDEKQCRSPIAIDAWYWPMLPLFSSVFQVINQIVIVFAAWHWV